MMLGSFFTIIVLVFYYNLYAKSKLLRVHFISVGYGDAILVELPDRTAMMIDAGEEKYAQDIVSYLKKQGVKKISTAILTHPHENHFGGFKEVFDKFSVAQFYINGDEKRAEQGYAQVIENAHSHDIPIRIVKRVEHIRPATKNVGVQILHPNNLSGAANENSIVIWITFDKISFLLTSDIQQPQQKEIIEFYPEIRSADVVQIPHHGGNINMKFAETLGNRIFIVSTGENKYGKPHQKELEKLQGKTLRTDVHGTIVFESDGKRVQLLKGTAL